MIDALHLPTVNAFLNGTSAVLVTLGYLCIRRRWVAPHAVCMLGATAVSALFLVSYVYYHYHYGATSYRGEGSLRPVYFTILISHTVLAVALLPLVIWTLYRAVHSQFAQHIRIARWTLPVWLYVSVTGVVVYLMLYQF